MTRVPPTLRQDFSTISADALRARGGAARLTLDEVLPLLRSPESHGPLRRAESSLHEALVLTDGEYTYPLRGSSPVLYPSEIVRPQVGPYLALSRFRQTGDINAAATDVHYERHLHRMKLAAMTMYGVVLDVGCDDPVLGAGILPSSCSYVGLDPFAADHDAFRLIGMGEVLPLADASVDGVMFNTSLDHILDYTEALLEAQRVLRPNGQLLISTLLWTSRATMLPDAVHFHHFKAFEIYGALEYAGFEVIDRVEYPYKSDAHRHGLYLTARRKRS